MRKVLFRVSLVLGVLAVLIQLVPVDRSNPPVTGEISAPEPVLATLRSSCYDCHSNETTWPWYSRVAPVSWRIAGHVEEAREHLNFSEWEGMSQQDRDHAREEIWDEVEKGAMPLWDYLWLHRDARLTPAQKEALREWANSGVLQNRN